MRAFSMLTYGPHQGANELKEIWFGIADTQEMGTPFANCQIG